jgi:predicted phosphoribosyltransferase
MRFVDRSEAGRVLAGKLAAYAGRRDLLVLALPRGGVPVAFEVAQALQAPLDVFLVRKLGVPGHEELAMGAIASGGVRFVNWDVMQQIGIPNSALDAATESARQELMRCEKAYRGNLPPQQVAGRRIILVDDGIATGASMRAAVRGLSSLNPAGIVVAVPVASAEACADLRPEAEEVICAYVPEHFAAVSLWYDNFSQTSDEEVRCLLEAAQTTKIPRTTNDRKNSL